MSSERLIGVIGSGTMGAGIAEASAAAGFVVQTLDTNPELVKSAYAKVGQRLDERVARGKLPRHDRDATMSRLKVATGYDDLRDAECVIEAVPEDLALKNKILAELDKLASPRMLLASNTSSLSIGKLGEGLSHAGRFLGMHFFNPAPVMKLIELVQGPATDEQAMVDARAICTKLDKTPVKVKDSPGFIGNRVNRPFYLEALSLLESGEADVRTIDAAVRTVGGFKMGPFELLDLIGLDINLKVTESVWADFGKPSRFTPSAIQRKLVAEGHLGRKSKRGFYDYSGSEPVLAYESRPKDSSRWTPTPTLAAFAQALEKPSDRATWLYARVMLAVMNEASIVAETIALPRDVNLTMELGFNYPDGPLDVADFVGLDVVLNLMKEIHRETAGSERFKPAPLLEKHVANGDLGEKTAQGFLHHWL
ncbi:MAG TPA: 3-hydroxyacyl-CoA dehydrogenase NAD-binding domain-containing protein [Phycisphaerae bacterium]|nr:3-hydroxyacyl-CoA dehydrogenase NAD-binding domain-containing protein [Phycisphaerae bacterium]